MIKIFDKPVIFGVVGDGTIGIHWTGMNYRLIRHADPDFLYS